MATDSQYWIEGSLKRAKEAATAIVALGAMLWFFVKPMVDTYIQDAIAGQNYATQESLQNLTGKTLKAAQDIGEVREKQIRQDEQLRNIEKLSEETRDIMRQLLQRRVTPTQP